MSWLPVGGKRERCVLALFIALYPAGLAAQSGGETASMVRIGDIVFAIPAALKPALDPRNADAKIWFDYSKIDIKGGPSGVRNADNVYIKLENLWPQLKPWSKVLAIQANNRAAKIDLFCRSMSRTGKHPDPSRAVKTDGQFYVFEEPLTTGPVYIAQDNSYAFGAPVTAWRSVAPLMKQSPPGSQEQLHFDVALSNNTRLSFETSEFRIPLEALPAFLASVEKQIRSWIVFPDPASFRWFHERDNPC